MVPRCLTIAGSDSGGAAGIQADLKAFARLGCHGMSAIVALTAQNTVEVTAINEMPVSFIETQLEALYSDIGVDAAKTGMLFSAAIIETVCAFLERHPTPLVVDPVLVASSGARLIQPEAAATLIERLLPLAAVVTPNLPEACALVGERYTDNADRRRLAETIQGFGPAAVLITGGHGTEAVDWLFDGERHVEIPVERLPARATHGAGCTHSAAMTALLARGDSLEAAARQAAAVATEAVRNGLSGLGQGEGPVDVIGLAARRSG